MSTSSKRLSHLFILLNCFISTIIFGAEASPTKNSIRGCILSCTLNGKQIECLAGTLAFSNSINTDYLFSVDLCYYPRIPPEISMSDQELYATQGVHIKKLDNNDIQDHLAPDYHVILAVRTLCTCPPKCSVKCPLRCQEKFFKDVKTCGGLYQDHIPVFINAVHHLLAPSGIAVLTGQSSCHLDRIKRLSERHHHVTQRAQDKLRNIFDQYHDGKKIFYEPLTSCCALMSLVIINDNTKLMSDEANCAFFRLLTRYQDVNASTLTLIDASK